MANDQQLSAGTTTTGATGATARSGVPARAAKQPAAPAAQPKPCYRKILDGGPLGVMCFYLMRWHSRLAIFFGYTTLVLVTVILLACSGYFMPGGAGNWDVDDLKGKGDAQGDEAGDQKVANNSTKLGEFVDY